MTLIELVPQESIFSLPQNFKLFIYSFGRNIPNSKSMLSMKLLILGKNLCSHMYVSKHITNLKCDTKSEQNIDDELVCRLKNRSSDRQLRSKRTRYRRIRNRRTRNRRIRNSRIRNRRTRNRRTRNRQTRIRRTRNWRTRKRQGIGKHVIGQHGVGEYGIGKHGIGEYRIGQRRIGEY